MGRFGATAQKGGEIVSVFEGMRGELVLLSDSRFAIKQSYCYDWPLPCSQML